MYKERLILQSNFLFGLLAVLSVAAGCATKPIPSGASTGREPNQKPLSSKDVSHLVEGATDKDSTADVMRLGQPISASSFIGSGVLQVQQPVAGRETHNLLTNPNDTTQPSFLILNEINAMGKVVARAFPVVKPITKESRPDMRSIFDPQFSPDGRYILFKFGYIFSPGIYSIYVFDTQTNQTTLACPLYLSYYALSWSPDGRYIAFAQGGEPDPRVYDNGRFYQGKLQLTVCNWRTGETYPVISSDTLRGPWNWKTPHSLLYGALSPQDEAFLHDSLYEKGVDFVQGQPRGWERLRGGVKRKPVTPGVYEYSVETRRSHLLCQDAYLPVLSPNGEYLASFGSADTAFPFALTPAWRDSPAGVFVVVTKADGTNIHTDAASDSTNPKGSKRTVLSQHYDAYPDLLWMPDNQHLLVLQQVANSPHARLEIKEWDVNTAKSRLVATLTANDPGEENLRSENQPMFQPLSLNENGTHLMVQVDEYCSLGENKGYSNKDTLRDIDLQTGVVTVVGQVEDTQGLDWHYKSVITEQPPTPTGVALP